MARSKKLASRKKNGLGFTGPSTVRVIHVIHVIYWRNPNDCAQLVSRAAAAAELGVVPRMNNATYVCHVCLRGNKAGGGCASRLKALGADRDYVSPFLPQLTQPNTAGLNVYVANLDV